MYLYINGTARDVSPDLHKFFVEDVRVRIGEMSNNIIIFDYEDVYVQPLEGACVTKSFSKATSESKTKYYVLLAMIAFLTLITFFAVRKFVGNSELYYMIPWKQIAFKKTAFVPKDLEVMRKSLNYFDPNYVFHTDTVDLREMQKQYLKFFYEVYYDFDYNYTYDTDYSYSTMPNQIFRKDATRSYFQQDLSQNSMDDYADYERYDYIQETYYR
ncbi:unnamed protein product [Gordionus sp. m RMFG-2023]